MYTLTKEVEIKNNTILTNQIVSNTTNNYQSTENDNLSIIESGKDKVVFNKIVHVIQGAKKLICLQSFLIQDSKIIDALLEKVKNDNVKVYVLSSANTRLEKIESEENSILTDYKKLLETKFKNNFIFRSSENFHAKYILIDPDTKNTKGYLCTNNFTENGFSKNIEISVELNKLQCNELFQVFVYHFWEQATHEQNGTKTFDFVKPMNQFIFPKLNNLIVTSPNSEHSTLEKEIIQNCEIAKKSISLATYNFDINHEIIQLLIKKSNQNIKITLFCHPKFNELENYKKLSDNGIKIILHENFHAKSLVIDDKIGFLFTGNIDNFSMKKNLEIGIKLNDEQTIGLIKILNHWEKNLSFIFTKIISVQDINQLVEIRKEGNIKKNSKAYETIQETKQLKTVANLVSFFDVKRFKMNNYVKSFHLNLKATFEKTTKTELIFNSDNYCILEEKKQKIIVINSNFTKNEISKIEKYKNFTLFCADNI